jgi:protein-tyrosine phosphatase
LNRLTDLHSHILPGVDDGPANWRQAEELFDRISSVMPRPSVIMATPHVRLDPRGRPVTLPASKIGEFAALVESAARGGLRVGFAAEILLDRRMPSWAEASVACFPGTSWLLVELPPRVPLFVATSRIRSVSAMGLKPVLAHPERCSFVRSDPCRLSRLASAGACLQVSVRSLVRGSEDLRETAWEALRSGSCHILASDCHDKGDLLLPEVEDLVAGRLGRAAWEALTCVNPSLVLADGEPEPIRSAP